MIQQHTCITFLVYFKVSKNCTFAQFLIRSAAVTDRTLYFPCTIEYYNSNVSFIAENNCGYCFLIKTKITEKLIHILQCMLSFDWNVVRTVFKIKSLEKQTK